MNLKSKKDLVLVIDLFQTRHMQDDIKDVIEKVREWGNTRHIPIKDFDYMAFAIDVRLKEEHLPLHDVGFLMEKLDMQDDMFTVMIK